MTPTRSPSSEGERTLLVLAGARVFLGVLWLANLAWKLAWVTRGRADRAILDSYDQERRPHAIKMIALAKLMGRIVMPRSESW